MEALHEKGCQIKEYFGKVVFNLNVSKSIHFPKWKRSLEDVPRPSTVHDMFSSSGERLIAFSQTVAYYTQIKGINPPFWFY